MNNEKLGKLIRMLSSPNEGEVVGAARALLRTLASDGSDIHELAQRVGSNRLLRSDMERIRDAAFKVARRACKPRRTSATSAMTRRPITQWLARFNTGAMGA